MATFCAICVKPIPAGEEQLAPLGKNDAMVKVCAGCNTEKPHGRRYEGYAYEPPVSMSSRAISKAVDKLERSTSTKRRGRAAARPAITPFSHRKRPGHVLVRIPIIHEGKARDAAEAIREKSWALEAIYIGAERQWHLYQVPTEALGSATVGA